MQVEPDLERFTSMLGDALKPYQQKYWKDLAKADGKEAEMSSNFLQARVSPENVWHTFQKTVDKALSDKSLNLDATFGAPRNDSSIFISIASYRDPSCRASLRSAFANADNPESVNVGVVQQNCESEHGCMTGTGWANTRRWVQRPGADKDCAKEFCESDAGRAHCEAGRVRILRLNEAQAYGPFFARYLNAKLWRGENYFMQLDAHSKFRTGWDSTMIDMMKRTPSYPDSVISTYPSSGTAEDTSTWPRVTAAEQADQTTGLCEATFEPAGGDRYTLRMGRSDIPMKKSGVPPYAAFVAAGFFFTHGSYVERASPDPFLPYIFMGEEVALSEKLWTNGFDIYAPTANVIGHEYVRSENAKFWESVNMVYDDGRMHNGLSNIIIERVQNLLGMPEARTAQQVDPTVLVDMKDYGVGQVRSQQEFLEMANINVDAHRQSTPDWCRQGTAPPHAMHPHRAHEL